MELRLVLFGERCKRIRCSYFSFLVIISIFGSVSYCSNSDQGKMIEWRWADYEIHVFYIGKTLLRQYPQKYFSL